VTGGVEAGVLAPTRKPPWGAAGGRARDVELAFLKPTHNRTEVMVAAPLCGTCREGGVLGRDNAPRAATRLLRAAAMWPHATLYAAAGARRTLRWGRLTRVWKRGPRGLSRWAPPARTGEPLRVS